MAPKITFSSNVRFTFIPGMGKAVCGAPMLPEIRRVTNGILNRALATTPKYADMHNDNYYGHARIDNSGFARGDVECGNWRSMQDNKKNNTLLKSVRG